MNIGIDIDGVMTDLSHFEITRGEKFFKRKVNNPKGYGICEKFNVDQKRADAFWKEYIEEYITTYPARDGVEIITHKLHEEGYKIIIITARKYNPDYTFMKPDGMPEYVYAWLKNNNIYYDDIMFTKENKINECKISDLKLMVEDKPSNIRDIMKINPVIVFDALCNENIKGDNIYHAKTWNEVY